MNEDENITVELDSVMEDIQRQARSLRISMGAPSELEKNLDRAFLRTVNQLSHLDPHETPEIRLSFASLEPPFPRRSEKRGARFLRTMLKRLTYRLTLWQMEDLTDQVNQHLRANAEMYRSIEDRVKSIELMLEGNRSGPPTADPSPSN